jgi:hypothetical protein
MAISAHAGLVGSYLGRIARAAGEAHFPLRPLSQLVSAALEVQRQRELENEAIRLLRQSGGCLTDSVEREIARKYLGI